MSHSWLNKSVAYCFGTYRSFSFWLFTLPVRRGRFGFGFFVDPIPSEVFTDWRLSVLLVKCAQIGDENGYQLIAFGSRSVSLRGAFSG